MNRTWETRFRGWTACAFVGLIGCLPDAEPLSEREASGDTPVAEMEPVAPHDWCAGHGVPESMCTVCNPSLVAGFQEQGDWCAGHGFPESVCPVCNPMTPPNAHATGQDVDWCPEHGLPESMCTVCSPSLVADFRQQGDWCAEHGFPESACPICNPMTPPDGAIRVELTPEAVESSGIRVERVRRGQQQGVSVSIPAEVEFSPDRVAHVSPLVDGQLVSISAEVGQTVTVGEELAVFRSVELGRARAELARARAVRESELANLERQERLRAEGIASERSRLEAQQSFDEADAALLAARSHLRVFGISGGTGSDMALVSPIEGMIVERHATRGENVSTSDLLFLVADASEVWVMGRVYEHQMSSVRMGMSATFSAASIGGRQWDGEVDYVALALDEETRTLPVRVVLDNSDGELRPGMFGTLEIADASETAGLMVPAGAVQDLDGRDVVFVQAGEELVFVARSVVVGRDDGQRVAILDGLEEGERVVVAGAFVLKSEVVRGDLADGCGGH